MLMTSDNNLHKHGKAMILLIIVIITKIVRTRKALGERIQ